MAIGNQPACANCMFFVPPPPEAETHSQGIGECRRFPPTTDHVLVGLDKKKGPEFHRIVQPSMTPAHFWCGEFIPKGLDLSKLPKKRGQV